MRNDGEHMSAKQASDAVVPVVAKLGGVGGHMSMSRG